VLSEIRILDIPDKALASKFGDNLQPDLLYIESILVSTGENANDDVFLAEEMWKARSSPIYKPMDWEHNTGQEMLEEVEGHSPKNVIKGNQIIGVMYNTHVATKDGNIIAEATEQAQIPADFHIVNRGVVYKYLFPNVAARIVRDAKAAKLFVSMEAWFKRYDYKVGNRIIARNNDTAFLDQHLRANGGNGSFKTERVGRVLRDITFGGVGFVANPANKDSIIQSFTNATISNRIDESLQPHILGELSLLNPEEAINLMADMNIDMSAKAVEALAKVSELEKALSTKDAEFKALKVEADKLSSTVDVFSAALAGGAASVASLISKETVAKVESAKPTDYMNIIKDAVVSVLADKAAAIAHSDEMSKKVAALEIEKLTAQVEALFAGATIDPALKARVTKLAASLSGKERDEYLADTKGLLGLAAMPPWLDKEKDKDKKDKKKDEEEADAAVLNSIRTQASIPAGSDNATKPVDLAERMKSLAAILVAAGKE
jgi:hypothetical protein